MHRAIGRDVLGRVKDVDDAGEGRPLADRHEERDAARAEGLADLAEDLDEVDVVGVHLGQGDQAAEPEPARLLDEPTGVDLDPGVGRDRHDHVLDGGQGAEGVADEVRVSRRVDQVDLLAGPLAMERVAIDREVATFLFVFRVGKACPVVDGAESPRDAGDVEHGVGQAGLARRPMSSQGNVADIGDVINRGHGASPKVSNLVISPGPAIAAPSESEQTEQK